MRSLEVIDDWVRQARKLLGEAYISTSYLSAFGKDSRLKAMSGRWEDSFAEIIASVDELLEELSRAREEL